MTGIPLVVRIQLPIFLHRFGLLTFGPRDSHSSRILCPFFEVWTVGVLVCVAGFGLQSS